MLKTLSHLGCFVWHFAVFLHVRSRTKFSLLLCTFLLAALFSPFSAPAFNGPLTIHPTNPRYFTDANGSAIYLTGSHTWANFQDKGTTNPPPAFDFGGYLDFLQQHHHNFIRLWTWEHTKTNSTEYFYPSAYMRTGPGLALDEGLKFDLNQFNPDYFNRLRSRVVAARDRGIYVSIMLFQGWSSATRSGGRDPWSGHPFNQSNNINGVNGDLNGDGQGDEINTLGSMTILGLQEAYIRKVVDTVNDLDNVLYEICNECSPDSKDWQYHTINYIKAYEGGKPKQHPVGMTYFGGGGPGTMDVLFASPADWISPGNDGGSFSYDNDPPSSDGRKVIISDTDHTFGVGGDQSWVWKSFTRGLNPIYMDPYDNPRFPASDSARQAMGDTLAYANRIDLATMIPTSDGYCLCSPGSEYLAFLPSGGTTTVNLSGTGNEFNVEWFNPTTGEIQLAGSVTGGANQSFTAPFSGDAVLHLLRSSPTPTVATPTITPNGGTFVDTVSVSLQTSTVGATIYYTTDGTAPSQVSRLYNGPFTLTNSALIKAKAYLTGYNDSQEASAWFTVTPSTTSTSSGLMAYWKFDEGSGTVATDSSGNSNTGTLFNGPMFTTGQVGGALSFDGVNDYVKGKSGARTGPFSVSLWVQAYKTNQAEWSGIFASADSPAVNTFQIDIGGTSNLGCNGQYRFYGQDKTGQNISLCFGPYTTGWQFLTATFDGTAIRLYVNGVLKASASPSFAGSIQVLKVGANRGTSLFFSGVVDEARVYNRALNVTEIQAIY
jgi:hypothetical protein